MAGAGNRCCADAKQRDNPGKPDCGGRPAQFRVRSWTSFSRGRAVGRSSAKFRFAVVDCATRRGEPSGPAGKLGIRSFGTGGMVVHRGLEFSVCHGDERFLVKGSGRPRSRAVLDPVQGGRPGGERGGRPVRSTSGSVSIPRFYPPARAGQRRSVGAFRRAAQAQKWRQQPHCSESGEQAGLSGEAGCSASPPRAVRVIRTRPGWSCGRSIGMHKTPSARIRAPPGARLVAQLDCMAPFGSVVTSCPRTRPPGCR